MCMCNGDDYNVWFGAGNEAEVELICWAPSAGASGACDAEDIHWRSGESHRWPSVFLSFSVYVLLLSAQMCWIIDVFAVVWRRGSAPIKVAPCYMISVIAVAHSLQVACAASRRRRRPFHRCWQRRGRRSSRWNRFVL